MTASTHLIRGSHFSVGLGAAAVSPDSRARDRNVSDVVERMMTIIDSIQLLTQVSPKLEGEMA